MPDKHLDGTLYLANREHPIHENYIPDVRKVNVTGMSQSMRDDAATALEEMFAAAKADKVQLASVSGYRGFTKQSIVYDRKLKRTGSEDKADELVARPGTSEHQLGMVMDIANKGSSQLTAAFGKSKGGKWVAENAHRFGFIVHYQEGWEEITGYSYEPWHLRYVGKEYATAIYESGLPMEHFISRHRLELYTYLIHAAGK